MPHVSWVGANVPQVWHLREAELSDIDEVVKLLKLSLPDDLIFSIFATKRNEPTFKLALANSNDIVLAIDAEGHLVGFVSTGNFSNFFREYFITLKFSGVLELLLSLANFKRLKNLLSATIYYLAYGRRLSGVEITWIAVASGNRKLGIGSDLLNAAIKINSDSKGEIFVKTLQKTPWNIEFYSRNDFLIRKTLMGRVVLRRRIGD